MKIHPPKTLAAVLAVGLLATACGDSTEADPAASESASPSESMSSSEATDDRADWPEEITFGFIPSSEAETLQDDVKPFEELLEAELGIEVKTFVTAEYAGLVEAMGTGAADLGSFGPTGYVLAEQRYAVEPLIQAIRFGASSFHGQYFTNDASLCASPPAPGAWQNGPNGAELVGPTDTVALQVGFNGDDTPETLDDGTAVDPGLACETTDPIAEIVKGRTFAFGSQTSTSGFIFPALEMLQAGTNWETDFEANFTGGHDTAVSAVYNGDADFGVSFDDARRSLRKETTDVGSKVIVIGITPEVPNDVVAVRADLPASLKQAIYDAVAKFLDTEEGVAIFDEIYGWTAIRPAVDSEFDIVRQAVAELGLTE